MLVAEKTKKRKYGDVITEEMIKATAKILAGRDIKRFKRSQKSERSRSRSSSSKKSKHDERHRSSHPRPRCCCCCCDARRNRKTNTQNNDKTSRIAAALHTEDPPQLSSTLLESARREHAPLIDEWIKIAHDGLSSTELKDLSKKYNRDENCLKELQAPRLSAEIIESLDSATLKLDETYAAIQNRSAAQMSSIEKVLGTIVQKGKQSTEIARLVENLHDIGRTTADFQHTISLERRRLICVALGMDDVDVRIEKGVDGNLFSKKTAMLLWKQKVLLGFKDMLETWKEEIMPTHNTAATQTEEVAQNNAAIQTDVTSRRSEVTQTDLAILRSAVTQTDVATQENTASQTYVAMGTGVAVQQNVQQAVIAPISTARIAEEEASVEANMSAAAAPINAATTAKEEASVERNSQRLVAKVEGARVAKEETPVARISGGIPAPDEILPDVKEIVMRAMAQRGFDETHFPVLTEGTWRNYAPHIRGWWKHCQINRVSLGQPTPGQVVKFFEGYVGLIGVLPKVKTAMGKLVGREVLSHTMVTNFFKNIKPEPK